MKTTKIISFFAILFSLFCLTACEDAFFHCIRGNNIISSETRSTSAFDQISNSGSFEVYVTLGSVYEIIVEAEENLLPYISTRVSNERLEINTVRNRCLRNQEPMKIYVTTPELYKLSLPGSGLIACDSINTNYFEANISGSGDIELGILSDFIKAGIPGSGTIELWGSADETEFEISGSGRIRTFDLEQNICFADISGSGSMYVFVNELLDINISGSGIVFYKGNPQIAARITGSGEIIKY